MALEQDQRISEVVKREQSRLRNFIRRRVPDPRDAEDILQDVFHALVEANRLLMPIEHVTAWLFRVARNRITDLFRKKRPESSSEPAVADEDDVRQLWNWLLPPLFGWRQIGFWQALGLLALCRILFGGFGRHGCSRSQITPEQRERFRQGMRRRFGFGASSNESEE